MNAFQFLCGCQPAKCIWEYEWNDVAETWVKTQHASRIFRVAATFQQLGSRICTSRSWTYREIGAEFNNKSLDSKVVTV